MKKLSKQNLNPKVQPTKDDFPFFKIKESTKASKKEELEYKELCLTSLTVCCTCDAN